MTHRSVLPKLLLVPALALLAGIACSPQSAAHGPATSSRVATAPRIQVANEADLLKLAQLTFPKTSAGYIACSAQGANFSNCPFTNRLRVGLGDEHASICRCQNLSSTLDMTAAATSTGGVIHVSMFGGSNRFDLIARWMGSTLLVDDNRCSAGDESSSIYLYVGPCSDYSPIPSPPSSSG